MQYTLNYQRDKSTACDFRRSKGSLCGYVYKYTILKLFSSSDLNQNNSDRISSQFCIFFTQVDLKSVAVFMPTEHIIHDLSSSRIAVNYSLQALKANNNCFPSTLVVCLPSLQLQSANHELMSVRQSLPVRHHHREMGRRETLPWTLKAENMAIYSVHLKRNSTWTTEDFHPVVHCLLENVSSTAVLASARTSSVSSSPLAPPQFLKPNSVGGRRVSTLGFCVHTDFQPIEVSCSRKQVIIHTFPLITMFLTLDGIISFYFLLQRLRVVSYHDVLFLLQMQLVANLLERLLLTCFFDPTTTTSADTTSGIPGSVPPTPTPGLKRTVSLTSSSGMDQVETESVPSESLSSTTISQVQQVLHYRELFRTWTGLAFGLITCLPFRYRSYLNVIS